MQRYSVFDRGQTKTKGIGKKESKHKDYKDKGAENKEKDLPRFN